MDAILSAVTGTTTTISAWIDSHVDLASIMLVVMLYGCYRMLKQSQRRKDFDLAEMLRDEKTGKLMMLNGAGIGAFVFSTWMLMHDTLNDTLTDYEFGIYLFFWSGAKVAMVIAQKWTGDLPWSKKQ